MVNPFDQFDSAGGNPFNQFDAGVKAAVGLSNEDHIVAIMHLGTRLK